MSSFKESKAFNLAETSGKWLISLTLLTNIRVWKLVTCVKAFVFQCVLVATAYIHHNMDKLSRIYPAGSRTDSSNYNPVPMWNVGCQIGTLQQYIKCYCCIKSNGFTPFSLLSLLWFLVALNFQTPSKEMNLNQGRFLPNGVCGYILKPEFQRSLSSQFDPSTLSKGPWLKKKTFHVMVRVI